MSAKEYVERLETEIRMHTKEILKLDREKAWFEAALTKYPDLSVTRKRNGEPQYYSKAAGLSEQWQTSVACSCCADAGFDLKTYEVFDGKTIFGTVIEIGFQGYDGIVYHSDALERMAKVNLHPKIIEHFRRLVSIQEDSDSEGI